LSSFPGTPAAPNPRLLLVGASGKTLAVLLVLMLYTQQQVSSLFSGLMLGDLDFDGLWFTWLWGRRATP
jgi:hypothetical protein